MPEPEKVTAGEDISLRLYGGGEEYEASYTVLPPCEDKQGGHWVCATHLNRWSEDGENCLDGYGRSWEGREGCRAVWMCHEHGPEQP